MPREPKIAREGFLALSPAATARACGLHGRVVAEGILTGALIVRQIGAKRRILVGGEGGIDQWLRSFPIAKRVPR